MRSDGALRITRRCLGDDLHEGDAGSGQAAQYVGRHAIVQAFVERRRQDPEGQETFLCATAELRRTIFTLHSGDERGATWHEASDDREADALALDVVWLLGVRPAHDYEALCGLARRNRLLPVDADYQELIKEEAFTFSKALTQEVPSLRTRAQAHAGQIVVDVVAERIPVRVYVDPDPAAPLMTVAVRQYPLRGPLQLPPTWLTRLVLAFFSTEPEQLVGSATIGNGALQSGEKGGIHVSTVKSGRGNPSSRLGLPGLVCRTARLVP